MSRGKYILTACLSLALAGYAFSLEPGKKYNFRFKDGQHLRNAILLEESKTTYRVRLEYIEEEKVLEKKDLREPPVLAHSVSVSPAPGSLLGGLKKILITYAEPVTGAENPENYNISGSATGTLKVLSAKPAGKYQYELLLSGQAADGDLVLRLANITDNVGARLISDSIDYKLDVTKPRVDALPAGNSPVPALKEVTLQYSESVRGADQLKNYQLSGAGLGSLKIKRVIQDTDGQYRYRLLFAGRSGNGAIKINFKNITDMVGNPPESPEISFTGDTIRPSLAVSLAADSLIRELKNIDLKFSEPVVGADKPENYRLTGSGVGDLRLAEILQTEDGRYRLNFTGTPASGSLSVEVTQVTDTAGNKLSGNIFSYRTDVLRPVLNASPAPETALAELSSLKITFSKPVTGADVLENYLLEGNGVGSLALREIRRIKGARYELLFAGKPGDGKITVRLKNIADAAGNPLQSDTIEYVADVTPPRLEPSPQPESTVNALKAIELQFSEEILGGEIAGNYALSGEGAGDLKIAGVEKLKENRFRLLLSGEPGNGKVVLKLNNIGDKAGNFLLDSAVSYRADVKLPELVKSFPAANVALREFGEIELQFSETVAGIDNPQNYILAGDGKGSLAVVSVTALPGDKVRLKLNGKPGEGRISLQLNNISDLAGNPLRAPTIEYRSDIQGPVLEADLPTGKVISGLKNIALRFSEVVAGADKAENYRITGAGAGSLGVKNVRGDKNGAYVLEFSGAPADGEITLQILDVKDLAGNPLMVDRLTFRADVTAPTMAVISPEKTTLSTLTEMQLNFSEPVSGAERAENYQLSGEGVGTLQIAAIEPMPQGGFRLALNGKPGNGKIALQLKNIADLAGNDLRSGKVEFQADTTSPSYEVFPQPGIIDREFSRLEISYSEAVSGGAEIKNYLLSGDGVGSLTIERVQPMPGNKYLLTLKGARQSGDIQLVIGDVTDLAGNELVRKPIVYQSDTVRPALAVEPPPQSVLNRLSQVTLRFSKPVVGAENRQNYSLTGDGVGTLRLEKVSYGAANEYQLVLSGTPVNGGITISLRKIADKAGNVPETESIHYELDATPVGLQVRPPHNTTLARLPEVELEFSKPVQGAEDVNNYLLSGDTAQSLKITSVESRGRNKYILRLEGEATGGSVQISIRNITDRAGNMLRNNRVNYHVEIPTTSQPCGDIVR